MKLVLTAAATLLIASLVAYLAPGLLASPWTRLAAAGLIWSPHADARREHSQTRPPSLTYGEATSLSSSALAHRTFDQLADRVIAASRPSERDRKGGLRSLDFAARPRSAGNPGLCVSDQLNVTFAPDGPKASGGAAPVRAKYVEVMPAYAVGGKLDPLPYLWSDEYEATLDRACSRLSDVWTFFRAPDSRIAWLSARLIEATTSAAKSSAKPLSFPLACSSTQGRCANARADLATLTASRIREVEDLKCPEGKRKRFCLLISVQKEGASGDGDLWKVLASAFATDPRGDGATFEIERVNLQDQTIIYN